MEIKNEPSLKDQVAFVAAGAAGIGFSCVERFTREGAKVAFMDRDNHEGEKRAKEMRNLGMEVLFLHGECTSNEDVEKSAKKTIEKWNKVDILVNCAGGFHTTNNVEEIDETEWKRMLDWNLTATYMSTKAIVPNMKKNNYGRIINVSSLAGRTGIAFTSIDYATAKSAVIGFTRRLAVELAPFGITANVVTPGTVWSPRVAKLHKDRIEQIRETIPVGREGTTEEIADGIWYLATPGASYITGATLDINGGMWFG